MAAVFGEVLRIPGPWPDERYQVRSIFKRKLLAYVRLARDVAACDRCDVPDCPHVKHVRAWLRAGREAGHA